MNLQYRTLISEGRTYAGYEVDDHGLDCSVLLNELCDAIEDLKRQLDQANRELQIKTHQDAEMYGRAYHPEDYR